MATTGISISGQSDKAVEQEERVRALRTRAGELKERKEPRFVKFGDGESIRGVLVAVERITVKNDRGQQQVSRYTLREEWTDEMLAFLGTYDIDTKLKPADVGKLMEIRCEGSDQNVTRNGNAMKRFKILVSDNRVDRAQAAGLTPEITDDDIPF